MTMRPWNLEGRWMSVIRSSVVPQIGGVLVSRGVVGGMMKWQDDRTTPCCADPRCPRCSDAFRYWEGRAALRMADDKVYLWTFPSHVMRQLARLTTERALFTGLRVRCEQRKHNSTAYVVRVSTNVETVGEEWLQDDSRVHGTLEAVYRCRLQMQTLVPGMFPEIGRMERLTCVPSGNTQNQ